MNNLNSITIDAATIGATLAPCEAADARAAIDVAFKTLLGQAVGAGTVYGSAQGKGEASKLYAELADAIALPAMVITGIRASDDGLEGAALLPTPDAARVLLVELFGVVQLSVKSAQRAAAKAMRNVGQGSKAKAAEASARKSITQGINRGLAGYGLKVDFYACKVDLIETPEEETDAEKAAKACAAALSKDFIGALSAFAELDAMQLSTALTRLTQYKQAADLAAEKEQTEAAEQAEQAKRANALEVERLKTEASAKASRVQAAETLAQLDNQAAKPGKNTATK